MDILELTSIEAIIMDLNNGVQPLLTNVMMTWIFITVVYVAKT